MVAKIDWSAGARGPLSLRARGAVPSMSRSWCWPAARASGRCLEGSRGSGGGSADATSMRVCWRASGVRSSWEVWPRTGVWCREGGRRRRASSRRRVSPEVFELVVRPVRARRWCRFVPVIRWVPAVDRPGSGRQEPVRRPASRRRRTTVMMAQRPYAALKQLCRHCATDLVRACLCASAPSAPPPSCWTPGPGDFALALHITWSASALGWLSDGSLRPIRTITPAATRDHPPTTSHQRSPDRPRTTSCKHLGDTVDDLLARLDAAFTAQRQFVATPPTNCAHHLARNRTLMRRSRSPTRTRTLDSLQDHLPGSPRPQSQHQDSAHRGLPPWLAANAASSAQTKSDLRHHHRRRLGARDHAVQAAGLNLETSLDPATSSATPP